MRILDFVSGESSYSHVTHNICSTSVRTIERQSAIRQDKVMLAAARMVRNCVPWVQDYYSEKKWYSCVPSLLKNREMKLLAQILETKLQMPPLTILSADENTTSQSVSTGIWDVFFSDRPHSNDKLRELIPPAVDALKMCKCSDSWQLPSDLPDPVLEWFQGQKQILFSNVSLSNFSDVVHALRQILPESEPNSAELLLDIFKKILIYQQETVKNVTGMHQGLWHSTFDGRAIDVFCKTCKVPQRPDSSPRWAVSRPSYYIVRERCCNSPGCDGQSRVTIPVDKDILYTTSNVATLYFSGLSKTYFDIGIYIRQQSSDIENYPPAIECWCIRCKELTEISDGSSSWTDMQARRTISTPSLYVERNMVYQRCQRDLRHGLGKPEVGRFIPIDSAIPSTFSNNLKNFHNNYVAFGLETRRILLRKLQPSSRSWNRITEDG
jgi:hypothetical protein